MSNVTPERSAIMRAVKGKNTKPEKLVRSALHKQGFRFRLHNSDLPGKPDLALPKYKTIVRVMGCFWHGHKCPRGNRMPKTNQQYWQTKIQRNVVRDKKQRTELKATGRKAIDVWECRLHQDEWIEVLTRKIKVD